MYEYKFLWGLMRRLRRKAALFPEIYRMPARWPRTLREFDDVVTERYCGFRGADDYYFRAAAARVVDKIAIPTLIVNSLDDPFIRILPETRAKILNNPRITLLETEHGGHCAFLAAANGYDGRWAEKQIIHFFRHHFSPKPGAN